MERGADWEREALRREWAAIERRRALAGRLAAGVALVLGGLVVLLLGLALPAEACLHGDGIAGARCVVDDVGPLVRAGVVLAGAALAVVGAWLCREALVADPYRGG